MNLLIVIPIVLGMLLLRLLRPGALVWAVAWLLAPYLFLRYGFATPIPLSVIKLYMGIVLLSVFAFSTSSAARREQTFGPIVRLIVEPRYRLPLAAIVLAVPALAAFNVYRSIHAPVEPPVFGRTVHPAPPDSIVVHDETIDLRVADNPLRELRESDPEAFRAHVDNGRRTYYRNCHFCHGDNLGGNGMFAHALNPIPTNFTDQGVLPMLQESFLFWRISKGAPGLPPEGGPWDSAMPVWERFLSTEEIWEVILFLYDYTGFEPRARGEGHE